MKWLGNAFQGEFGISYKYKQDVLTVIKGRLVNTLLLGGIGFILTFGLALLLGIFCVYYENQLPDRILRKVGTITSCIPEFWLSLILILIFSVNLKLLPGSGAYESWPIGKSVEQIDASDSSADSCCAEPPLVLCLSDPQPIVGRNEKRLCFAGKGERNVSEKSAVLPLREKYYAIVYQSDGNFTSACD